jgi:hypothetical protein
MKRIIKVRNKEELKEAILSCKKAKCDTLIILNGQTEYLIYKPFISTRTAVLFCETDKSFLQVIKNINKIAEKHFLPPKSKLRRKGFQL